MSNTANVQNVPATNTITSTTVKDYMGSNIGLVVVASVLFFVVVYVIVFIYKKYNSTSLKTVTMLKKPLRVSSNQITNISSGVSLPELYNGKEYSYSMWIYVEGDNEENTTTNKFVMGRMTTKGNISDANPLVVLDKSQNKLYVYIKPTESFLYTLDDIPNKSTTMTIPYLPLQRWVNILIVVDNNFIQLFMDGELREVKDLSENNRGVLVANTVGNILVGGSDNMPSFNGFLSKIQAFNYAVTIDHAKVIYKAGPLHRSILSSIGVPHYGIQSPFYRIDQKTEVTGCSS